METGTRVRLKVLSELVLRKVKKLRMGDEIAESHGISCETSRGEVFVIVVLGTCCGPVRCQDAGHSSPGTPDGCLHIVTG